MANSPVPQYLRKAYNDFSGGLNNFNNPLVIRQNQFNQLDNALVNYSGILERSTGTSTDGSPFPNAANSFIRMMVNFRRGTTVDNLVVAAQDDGNTNANYKVDIKQTVGDGTYNYIGYTTGTASFTSGNTAVTGTSTDWLNQLKAGDKIKVASHTDAKYTEIASIGSATGITLVGGGYLGASSGGSVAYIARIVLHKDYIPTSVVFNNVLIVSNGEEIPYYWDNTTTAKITNASAPKGKFIELYKNRVFMALNSNLYWSASGDQTTWDAAGVEPVFPQDNGNIIGIRSFSDSIIVFKDNGKIYQVLGDFGNSAVGSPSYKRQVDVPDNIGIIAGFSIALHDDGRIYFVSQTGVYAMDQRLQFTKISWNIQNDVLSLVLRSGSTTAKSYTYATQTQWNTGTASGVRTTTNNTLQGIFDSGTCSNYYRSGTTGQNGTGNRFAITTDASNNVHIAYSYSSNGGSTVTIRYQKYDSSNNLILDENAVSSAGFNCIAIAVAANGNVGIVGYQNYPDLYNVQFFERTASWAAGVTIDSGDNFTGLHWEYISMCYNASSDPRIAYVSPLGATFSRRAASVWSKTIINADFTTRKKIRMVLKSDSNPCAITFNTSSIICYNSTNDGASWSTVETFSDTVDDSNVEISINGSDQIISCYKNTDAIKTRNHSSTTTSTIVTGTSNSRVILGYKNYNDANITSPSDKDYLYYIESSSGVWTEKFYFESVTTIGNSSTGTISGSTLFHGGGVTNNGSQFVYIAESSSSSVLQYRRIAYRGKWTQAISNDSTLTAWGTYAVTGSTLNGGGITHQVAINNTSTLPAPSTIIDGQVIGSDATKVYIQATITMTIGSFSAPEVASVIENYTGSGVGAAFPCSIVYNNEYYIAVAVNGGSTNSKVYFYDKNGAWATRPYAVTVMCRYKTNLYGGSSTAGDVYRLNNGYGSSYTTTAITKEDILGSLELQKDIYKIYVLYATQDSGTFTFSWRSDNFIASPATWHDTVIDQTKGGIAEIPITTGLLRTLQFKVTCNASGANMGIIGFVIVYGFANIR